MNNTLSIVISAYNEEKALPTALNSIVSLASEIIIVDNQSMDKTASVARKHKAKIFTRPNNLMLNINKNFGFSKASGDWILNLDADEEIPKDLLEEIRTILTLPITQAKRGYWIARKNIIFGQWIRHGLWWPDKQLRLFQRGFGRFPCIHIHEYIEVDGETGICMHPFLHHNYDTISQYLTKLERCTTSEAKALEESQYRLVWYDAIRFPVSDFIKVYFAQHGYKDGLHGLVLSLLQAFYSFVVFAKQWEKKQFFQESLTLDEATGELSKQKKELSYWILTSRIHEAHSLVIKLLLRIRRRLSL